MHRKQAQTGEAEGELGGERKKQRAGGNTCACKVSTGGRLLSSARSSEGSRDVTLLRLRL